ncbi:hypothetical protein BaRGS_00040126 [Batillaria attramentaria]|uniref:Uncharacterized protein n=1 Tax=Batillaria attramentaria TaxID=370345 RepID=A0ABD0J158_9CAEN
MSSAKTLMRFSECLYPTPSISLGVTICGQRLPSLVTETRGRGGAEGLTYKRITVIEVQTNVPPASLTVSSILILLQLTVVITELSSSAVVITQPVWSISLPAAKLEHRMTFTLCSVGLRKYVEVRTRRTKLNN